MWRHVASNALTFFVIALFMIGGLISLGKRAYVEDGPLAQAICLKVDRGSAMSGVADQLLEQGAISSKQVFSIGVDYAGQTRDLKAGSFLIPVGASMQDIAAQITSSGRSTCGTEIVYRAGVTSASVLVRELNPANNRFEEVARFNPKEDDAPEAYTRLVTEGDTRLRFAVAEGVTSWQIVDTLKSLDVLEGDVDAVPAEGSLAPDSYELSRGDTRQSILDRMAEAQIKAVTQVWENKSADTPVDNPADLLILASIIEKETGVAEERGQVASVFANRLKQGMKLQTDPTVIYGITKGQGTLGRGLRRSELRNPTPWNTYTIDALPPTPIANPGLASLQAAANPASTDFIFFVADGTGGHAFAVTLEEHNRNVAAWRAIEAARDN